MRSEIIRGKGDVWGVKRKIDSDVGGGSLDKTCGTPSPRVAVTKRRELRTEYHEAGKRNLGGWQGGGYQNTGGSNPNVGG